MMNCFVVLLPVTLTLTVLLTWNPCRFKVTLAGMLNAVSEGPRFQGLTVALPPVAPLAPTIRVLFPGRALTAFATVALLRSRLDKGAEAVLAMLTLPFNVIGFVVLLVVANTTCAVLVLPLPAATTRLFGAFAVTPLVP